MTNTGYSTGAYAADVAAHAAAGGVLNDLQGGNFGSGFLAAGITASASPAIQELDNAPERIMVATVVGGTVSKITGDKFANGAVTAFFQQAFGEVANPMRSKSGESATSYDEGGTVTDPTADWDIVGRDLRAWGAESLANDLGIRYGSGASVNYVDAYKYFLPGPESGPFYCSANCNDLMNSDLQPGVTMIFGEFNHSSGVIALYRGAVESSFYDYSIRNNAYQGIYITSGLKNAVLTLGHEAYHSLWLNSNNPVYLDETNAERAGFQALTNYREYLGGR